MSEIYQERSNHSTAEEENTISQQLQSDHLRHEIANLHKEKERLLTDLQETIEEEKQAWEEQKKREKEAAQASGYQVGYETGHKEAIEKYHAMLEKANKIVSSAKADYDKTVSKYEYAVIQLAVSIAGKILKQKIDADPELFQPIVKEAISDLKDSSNVEVYVHPSKYELIISQKEELEQLIKNEDVLSVYIDSSLAEQDCMIKHPYGQVDLSVDTQLEQIKRALEEKVMER